MRLTITATASVSSLAAAPGILFIAFLGGATIPFIGLASAFVSVLIAGFGGGATAFLVFLTFLVFHVRKFLVKSSTLLPVQAKTPCHPAEHGSVKIRF